MDVCDCVDAEAPAHVLALILSADGSVSERTLGLLGHLGAFGQLGVTRQRFIELARDCNDRVDPGLCERSWLSGEDIMCTERLLDAVVHPDDRILVCRLAAAAMEDDGLVTHGTRLVFEHALAHWRIGEASLSEADRKGRFGKAVP